MLIYYFLYINIIIIIIILKVTFSKNNIICSICYIFSKFGNCMILKKSNNLFNLIFIRPTAFNLINLTFLIL